MVSITHGGNAGPLAAPDLPLPPTSPDHYDTENWETQIPASGSGDAGGHKDKGMELLHRAPELSLELVVSLLLSAPDPAFQMLLQKRLLLERRELRDCPLPASLSQPELPAPHPAKTANPTLSADNSQLSTPHPQLGLFL